MCTAVTVCLCTVHVHSCNCVPVYTSRAVALCAADSHINNAIHTIRHQTSDIRHQTSDVRHQTGSRQFSTFSQQHVAVQRASPYTDSTCQPSTSLRPSVSAWQGKPLRSVFSLQMSPPATERCVAGNMLPASCGLGEHATQCL